MQQRNCSGNCPKSSLKCTSCGGSHSAAYKGYPLFYSTISKSLDRKQTLSYAQAVSRRAGKEEIDASKANVIINVQELTKIITTVIWEINREEYSFNDQLASRVAEIERQSVNNSTV